MVLVHDYEPHTDSNEVIGVAPPDDLFHKALGLLQSKGYRFFSRWGLDTVAEVTIMVK